MGLAQNLPKLNLSNLIFLDDDTEPVVTIINSVKPPSPPPLEAEPPLFTGDVDMRIYQPGPPQLAPEQPNILPRSDEQIPAMPQLHPQAFPSKKPSDDVTLPPTFKANLQETESPKLGSPRLDQESARLPPLSQMECTNMLPIDGLNREVRAYGLEVVIFMDWNDPRDLSFLPANTMLVIDNVGPGLPLAVGHGVGYTEVSQENIYKKMNKSE